MDGHRDEVIILLVEDDEGHAQLIRERFANAGVSNEIRRFLDGAEAWKFLTGAGPGFRESGRQYLMLLDIRMPGMDGVELLRRIKRDETLKKMPVIMLTTTDDPREVDACYALGCNSYLTKPVAFAEFSEVVKRLGLFISVVKVTKLNGV